MTEFIEGMAVPPNEGGLPLDIEHDEDGEIVSIRIRWRGHSIREQFPWTMTMKDCELR